MIIQSILDTDLYKFTMQQAVLHQFPHINTSFTLFVRGGIRLADFISKADLELEIENLSKLSLATDERQFLHSMQLFTPDYLDYLSRYRFDPKYVSIVAPKSKDDDFKLIIEGPWRDVILFEVPVLAIIGELYHRGRYNPSEAEEMVNSGQARLADKLEKLSRLLENHRVSISEFGTRRRESFAWQQHVVNKTFSALKRGSFTTSNVHLAQDIGIRPMGTMAHEWIQAGQALVHPEDSQVHMLQTWLKEYNGKLGIALSDTLGFSKFLSDFNSPLASAYAGARHDSGDPVSWGESLIDHYDSLGIDPKEKMAVFSDGLDTDTVISLCERFSDRIGLSFGIGTHFVHDFGPKWPAIQVVIKMTECQGRPVCKISDTPGKATHLYPEYEAYLREEVI